MADAPIEKWQQRALKKVKDEAIDLTYEVLEIEPDKHNKNQTYQIAGNPGDLVAESSGFVANVQYIQERFGNWNFEDFDIAFRNAFPNATPRPKAWGTSAEPWGRPIGNQPKFVEVNKPSEDGYVLLAFYPDKDNEDECYPVMGNINDIVNQVMNIWHSKMLLSDTCRVIGSPVTEYIRYSPVQQPHLIFYLTTRERPPFYRNDLNPEFREHKFTIHYPKKSALSYENVKAVLGGNNGMIWGRWKATAWLVDNIDNHKKGKGAHQVWVGGSSEEEAVRNLKSVLQLTNGKVLQIKTSHSKDDEGLAAQDPELLKMRQYKVFPKCFTVINPNLVSMAMKGRRKALASKMNTKWNDFVLWPSKQPPQWSKHLDEFLRVT